VTSTRTHGRGATVDGAQQKRAQSVPRVEQVEPWQDLSEDYRRAAARMIEFHMMSEIVGPVHEFRWVPRAPSLHAKLVFAAKSQDEIGHGLMLMRVCEDLTGKSRAEYIEQILDGPPRFMNIFHYPWDEWVDPAIVAWLIDGAEIERQATLLRSSYGPYARAMRKIVKEEGFHHHCGRYLIGQMMDGTPGQRSAVQRGVDRWWLRTLAMFGPSDENSKHGPTLMAYGLKLSHNEALRQSFLTKYVPQIRAMGVEVPDDKLSRDEETGRWTYTEPDWAEFSSLLRGGSPVGADLQRELREARGANAWLLAAA
jgi:ring-1,2-phenylacetyl-CoA epoxidase subunit PaaA